jgi:hypothetical protein
MSRAISNPKLMYKDNTLGACHLLAMYEAFECPANGRSAYLTQYEGLATLIKRRGPEAHRTGMSHSIFLAFRTMGISSPSIIALKGNG